MKDDNSIYDFFKLIQERNEEIRIKNMTEDPSSINWKIDLFKQFKQLGLIKKYEEKHYINLW